MWTDDDFRVLFNYLRDVRAIFRDCPERATEFASVLIPEGEEASRRLARISEAVGGSAA